MIFLTIGIFILFILMSAYVDVEGFKKGNFFKSHTSRFLLRGLVMIGMATSNWLLLPLFITLWILIFDYSINLMWGKDMFYLGKTAKWDIMLGKINKYVILGARIALVTGSTLLLLLL